MHTDETTMNISNDERERGRNVWEGLRIPTDI